MDGPSGYRCSLRDSSNVRKDGKPTFPRMSPRPPRGEPVIKTRASQHSTMNAPYLPSHRERARGEGAGDRRQLVNSRQLSPIRWNKGRRGNDKIESWDDLAGTIARCRGKGGAHKASEWRGGEEEGKNSCRIPPGSPFHTPDATTSQRFRPQKIPLSHSNVTKDDSRPSSPSPSVAPKRKRKSSPN